VRETKKLYCGLVSDKKLYYRLVFCL